MFKKIYPGMILAFTAILLITCANHEKPALKEQTKSLESGVESRFIEKPLRALRVDSVQVKDGNAQFSVKLQTPDVCWKYSRHEVKKDGNQMLITIFGKRDREEICAQMIGTLTAKINLDFAESGSYQCKFWSGESEPVETTISIAK